VLMDTSSQTAAAEFTCQWCGDAFRTERRDAHETLWCARPVRGSRPRSCAPRAHNDSARRSATGVLFGTPMWRAEQSFPPPCRRPH
jgi:hypothetical protein